MNSEDITSGLCGFVGTIAVVMVFLAPSLGHASIFFTNRTTAGTVTPSGTWTNPNNAASINSACALGDGLTSSALTLTNWGFTIPAGSTILGITVRSESSFDDVSTQDQIRLTKAGLPTGTIKQLNGPGTQSVPSCSSPIPNSNGITSGSATDLWGTTWTVAEVNAVGFGVFYDNTLANTVVDGVIITVSYDDGTGPCTVTCPFNLVRSNDPNECGAVVNFLPPTTSGSCGTVMASPASGTYFPRGTTTVTATTSAGPSCTFTVTVVDTQPPNISCVNAVVRFSVELDGRVVTYPSPFTSDNCPGVSVQSTPPSGSFFPVGVTTATSTATDGAGNADTCSFQTRVLPAGDFNRDFKPDLLWRHYDKGQNSFWLMEGTSWAGSFVPLPTVSDLNWVSEGSGDFNDDGHLDILWRNYATGANSIWLMNLGFWPGTFVLLPEVTGPGWHIEGMGHFNDDTSVDIVWRNRNTGQDSIWFLNGTSYNGSHVLLPTIDVNWRIEGAGDFNNDGEADLLWRNYVTGQNSIWFLNNGVWSGGFNSLPTVGDPNWTIEAVADYDADGDLDIFWRHYGTGQNAIWIMVGANWDGMTAAFPTPVPDTLWRIEDY